MISHIFRKALDAASRFFRRIRTSIAVYYYGRIYDRCMRKAEELHEMTGRRYYVTFDWNNRSLMVLSRKGFRHLKTRVFPLEMAGDTMDDVRGGAFYYTSGAHERDYLPPSEVSMRRMAFITCMLHRINLA